MIASSTQSKPIRVLVADDSSVMRAALSRMIESDRDLQIVGYAVDGVDVLTQMKALDPDVITLDIEMPRMNGLDALTHIMAESPRPVIMLSSLTGEGTRSTFEALERGAFDFIASRARMPRMESLTFAKTCWLRSRARLTARDHYPDSLHARRPRGLCRICPGRFKDPPQLSPIGTSTGGPKALQAVLSQLPAQLSTGVLVVQLMSIGFTAQFAERLNHICEVAVHEVKGEELIEPGIVYIAPAGLHMTVNHAGARYRTHLSKSPAGTLHTPSVDVLMHSVARVYGSQAMGVILTGMGADGAQGMKAIRDAGGWTIGQDAESCAVYGMPRSAAEIDALSRVAPLQHIAAEIMAGVAPRTHAAAVNSSARSG